jgi:SOS-response transcriptional repressor LexA
MTLPPARSPASGRIDPESTYNGAEATQGGVNMMAREPRWQWVRVSGPSMAPALRNGDRLLVRHGATVRAGDIVLGRFADLPGVWVVKRAVRPLEQGWIVASDNSFAGGDSAVHGPAQVSARAVLLRRGIRLRRIPRPTT